MLKEIIGNVISTWNLYWGEGFYQYLLLAAVLYLLVFHRKKEAARKLLTYTALFLFLFFFPPTAWVIQKCVGSGVYWRVLWLLPSTPMAAYAGTLVIRSLGKKRMCGILSAAAVVMGIVFCGESMWQAGNYEKVNNYQKVPDEVAQICEVISAQKEEGETIVLAADDYLASYIRVYDPSIYMLYGRRVYGARRRASKRIYEEMNSPSPNVRRIVRAAKRMDCHYLVFPLPGEKKQNFMAERGFTLLATVNQYGIFKLTEET